MPLYDYQCRACSKVTEVRHGFRETYDATCAECGGDLARVFNPAGIVFKGSGFYVNDSRKASSTESASDSTTTPTPSTDSSAKTSPSADSPAKKSESSAA
jgi:putative FmdB family regulatory protein